MKRQFTEEQNMLQETTRKFAREELAPTVETRDDTGTVAVEAFSQLAEMGYFGITAPEEAGGLGMDLTSLLLVLEELAREDMSTATMLLFQNQVTGRLLRDHPLAESVSAGEIRVGIAWAEPDWSGCEHDMQSVLQPQGDDYILQGRKQWAFPGTDIRHWLVLARLGEGVAAALIPADSAGLTAVPTPASVGLRSMGQHDLELVDVRVTADQLLMEDLDDSLQQMKAELRLGLGAIVLGMGESALSLSHSYSQEREQFGRPIISFDAIQNKLTGMRTRLDLLWHWLFGLASSFNAQDPYDQRLAAETRLLIDEVADYISREAVQTLGGYGYTRDYPVERMMRDALFISVWTGTGEQIRREVYNRLELKS